jgi:hypothetical protein
MQQKGPLQRSGLFHLRIVKTEQFVLIAKERYAISLFRRLRGARITDLTSEISTFARGALIGRRFDTGADARDRLFGDGLFVTILRHRSHIAPLADKRPK